MEEVISIEDIRDLIGSMYDMQVDGKHYLYFDDFIDEVIKLRRYIKIHNTNRWLLSKDGLTVECPYCGDRFSSNLIPLIEFCDYCPTCGKDMRHNEK